MTIIAYIRVSSDKQTCSNQHFTINEYAKSHNLTINKWVEETISSRKPLEKRELGCLLRTMCSGDTLIITEISRLARNLYELAEILQDAIKRDICVISIKQNYIFKNDIQSKIMACTFGLAAEIERDLISTRTKMSLDKLKKQNIKLGRPLGAKARCLKLARNQRKIKEWLAKGLSQNKIAKLLGVHPTTMCRYLKKEKSAPRTPITHYTEKRSHWSAFRHTTP
ncbi:MAG: recombinase family protein [Alphaproteobacteria bacterium]|nr:recombinase family protein [Alphaproteobacteria bacterium]